VANVPSVPEIITVNSEVLQTTIRDLLPSQNGFGSELQASNVIMPIIDLTATAEGSALPVSLQQAIAFGSQTAFNVTNTTTALLSSTGFFRIVGTVSINDNNATSTGSFQMTDGSSTKIVWAVDSQSNGSDNSYVPFDLIFFLPAGITLNAVSSNAGCIMAGSHRQVADGQGSLIQPSGFPL
jgi:hypothetical protein